MVEQAAALYLYIEDASRAVRFLSAADEVESTCTNRGPGTAFFSYNALSGPRAAQVGHADYSAPRRRGEEYVM